MDDVPSSGPEFFDIRYAAGRMPWDYGGVQNSLKAFLNRHHGPGHVLIPGCGSGYEIETFSSAGWDVIGIDYSAVGVARARRLLGPLAHKVYEGDFFTHPLREAFFDLIYERTFLCTLLPDVRPQYAQRLATLIGSSSPIGDFLLVRAERYFERSNSNPV